MSAPASLIQRLHRINRQKTDLSNQLARGPRVVATVQTKLKSAEDQLGELKSELMRSRVDADSKQLQMKEREEKIRNLEGKLNAAKENREYQALKDQIAADTQANLVLSDEILEMLESIDEQVVGVSKSEGNVEEVAKEVAGVKLRISDKKAVLESELERIQIDLRVAENDLSGDFQREYRHLVAAKGEDGMAEIEGNCCGGCYQSLTLQLLDRTKIGQPILCPSCGRILYVAT